jgi:hypothetical protein
MKRGYKVSIGGSFFAGSGDSAKMGKQDGRGNQQYDPDTDINEGEPQPQQDVQDTQPQQQKQPRMLTNLARYNAPGIKDNKMCQVSLVCLWSVCGAKSSNYVNLHFLLSCPSCLLSFSGVSALSVVCLWCQKFKFCKFTLPPFVSTLSVVVFRCLWAVCGLSVICLWCLKFKF